MIDVDQYQILQIIGLSLPFLALYLTVLVEIHKVPKPIQVKDPNHDIGPMEVHPPMGISEKEWAGTVTISYAYQKWDFVFSLLSVIFILISALLLIATLIINSDCILFAGLGLFVASYLAVTVGILFTLRFCYQYFSPSDD